MKPTIVLLVTITCLLVTSVQAQREGSGDLDSKGRDWDGKPVRPYEKWEVDIDEDSSFGMMRQTVNYRPASYRYGPIGIWTSYYLNGGMKSHIYYDTDSTQKLIDFWLPSGEQTAENGLGFTIRISGYHKNTYDSIITQIVDSVVCGYEEVWLISKVEKAYRRSISFRDNDRREYAYLSFFKDGSLQSLRSGDRITSMNFYQNGMLQSIYFKAENGKLSYCFEWFDNGKHALLYQVANDHKKGKYISFYENGGIKERGTYVQVSGYDTIYIDKADGSQRRELIKTKFAAVKDGIWLEYYSGGAILSRRKYVRGVLTTNE